MFVRTASFCSLLMVLSTSLGATAQSLDTLIDTANSDSTVPLHLITDREEHGSLPGFVARRIQKDLGKRLNVPFHELSVTKATPQVWPDACLGVANPDEVCAQGNVRGWEVTVDSEQQRWVYRSDRAAERLRLITPGATEFNHREFSSAIAQKILETASQQVQEPVDNLQVLSVQSAIWDGCLGIAAPDQSCTKNLVPGFRVIVGSEPRAIGNTGRRNASGIGNVPKEWVYHVSQDGSQIVQNTAASNTERFVGTYLMHPSTQTPELGSDIFKLTVDNYLDGPSRISLAADGTVYYETFDNQNPEETLSKEALYQISLEDVAELEALLTQQRFSNFDRMSYGNQDSSYATEGSVILTAAGASVRFNAEETRLPAMLRPVVAAVFRIAS